MRKIIVLTSLLGTSSLFVAVTFVDSSSKSVAVLGITIATGLSEMNRSGVTVNMFDIAPNLSGVIMGMCALVYNMSGVFQPIVAGYVTDGYISSVTNEHTGRDRYRLYYGVSASVTVLGALFYAVYGTAEKQDWDDDENNEMEKLPLFENNMLSDVG